MPAGNWTCMDGTNLDFSTWALSEPQNATGNNCATLPLTNGLWKADDCFKLKLFPTHSCYGYGSWIGPMNWTQGEDYCLGCHLTSIHSYEEEQILISIHFILYQPIWTGAISYDGGIRWVWSDETLWDYNPWGPNDPYMNTSACAQLWGVGLVDHYCSEITRWTQKKKEMKQFLLFILIFITIKFIGVVEPIPTGDVYHGNQRYWTLEANENTYLALHVLKESIKLVFPKEKTIGELLSGLKLYSPSENGKCEDTIGSLDFTLVIDVQNHIRGAAFVDTFNNIRTVKTHLFEKCGSNEQSYASPPIDVNPTPLEDRSRQCFQSTVPFQVYDNIKHVMELQVSGTFQCQVFMELPSYMKIENVKLPEYKKIGLNETFLGHDETFWWKTGTDKMLPSAVSFDSNRNVKLDVLKSTKMIPYFFRIGSGQPIPSMKFIFGSNCNDAKFELFANLRDSSDCKIGITLIQDGYEILTKNGVLRKIKDSTKSPTLIFGENQVYVKVASPLSINEFETCQLRNTPDVPADQFVLQLGPPENIATCDKAEIILHHSDVVNGIEVLIDRSKIPVPIIALNETSDNSTNSSSPDGETASAAFEWWWWLIAGILLVLVLVIVAVLIYMFCYRRGWCCKKQKKTKSPKIQLSSIENEQELVTRK
uniref:C-type lectin domain-containing protein n=1 Tax=Panagrolaimus sp. ES5 TaxID=591445 RepID=A0AC34FR99_9BILA